MKLALFNCAGEGGHFGYADAYDITSQHLEIGEGSLNITAAHTVLPKTTYAYGVE